MYKKSINWDNLNIEMKLRYQDKINDDDNFLEYISKYHLPNLDWLEDKNIKTKSYEVFVEEFNEIQMSINAFENLMLFADLSFELIGIEDFPIDMPRQYFRFPALNDRRDIFSYRNMSPEEIVQIEKNILKAQTKMNIRNDENIIREHFTKLEFLTIFSSFEAYLENIYVEFYLKENLKNEEKLMKEAGVLIKMNSLDKSIKKIINIVNPELENLLLGINKNIFDFFYISYLVRNIHTHKLGRMSNHFIESLKNKNLIKEKIIKKNNEIIGTCMYIDCIEQKK
ncbi:hypothetical protein FE246_07160 [Aliarcobacter thereius]|uniref:Uncharacterized protein n=1 Tax=Aliarcobacter thereius TaxID=544718 RepID=A0A5R9GZW2_9BACT|nr:hypothetical protein [Aliarcobacter thereius]TLS71383.1 hypothetical protein FE246_07160 [Aliarcobacter thereius]